MSADPEHLDIGATGRGGLDLDQELAGARQDQRNLANLDLLAPYEKDRTV